MCQAACSSLSWESSLFLSLAIPQFGLLSQVSSLRLSPGHSGLVLTLSTDYAARASLSSPRLLVADAIDWATSPLAAAYSVGFFFFSSLLVVLPSEIPRLPTDPHVRGFPTVWKLLLQTPSPGWVSIPNSFVSPFVFYILSCLLLKRMGCLSGCLVSSASIQKLFCGSCSTFR